VAHAKTSDNVEIALKKFERILIALFVVLSLLFSSSAVLLVEVAGIYHIWEVLFGSGAGHSSGTSDSRRPESVDCCVCEVKQPQTPTETSSH
jgi:hypothetical protein